MYGRLARGMSMIDLPRSDEPVQLGRAGSCRRAANPMDRRQRPPHIIATAARMERAVSASCRS
jgi:hypothetical protein